MKEKILVVSLIGILLLGSISSVGLTIKRTIDVTEKSQESLFLGNGKTRYVDDDGDGDFTSIQDAINASSKGDTIHVYHGIYQENVVINKPLIIKGDDRETTIIDGMNIDSTLRVNTSSASVSAFTIRNSSSSGFHGGIHVRRYPYGLLTDIHISNCIIENNSCGMRFTDTSTVDISNCIIKDNLGPSLYLIDSFQFNIMQCNIYNNGEQLSDGWYHPGGIIISSGNNIVISDCNISKNIGTGVSSCHNIKIYNNNICGNYNGISIEKTKDAEIHYNNINGNFQHGIYISAGRGPIVDINIHDNTIMNNGQNGTYDAGVYLQHCENSNVTIKNNNISSNSRHGVRLLHSSGNKILENNFIENTRNAYFRYEHFSNGNLWDGNYWDRPRLRPKSIFGIIGIHNLKIPWFNFDRHPAKEPYNI